MRPLRFALFVAVASAICVVLGRLWIHSLDQGSSPPVERILHAGSGAVAVAIAGVDAQVARARREAAQRERHVVETRQVVKRQTPLVPRTSRPVAPVLVVEHAAPPAVAHPTPVVAAKTSSHPNAAPAPKPKPKSKPKPSPGPTRPPRTPSPTPPQPQPQPKPTPAPTPPPPTASEPAPASAPPSPPAPGPAPPTPPAPAPPAPAPPDLAPPPPSQPTPEPPQPNDPTPPPDPTPPSGDRSRPGWGHGDDNHDHTGPPGHIGDWDHGRGHDGADDHHGSGSG